MKSLTASRNLLRFHGLALFLLGSGNAVVSYAATKTEIAGPFAFLYTNPFPEVGFLQAYLLAALVGVILLLGSRYEDFYVFDIVGMLMHLIPPTALVLMYDHIVRVMGPDTIRLSISIHAAFVTLEIVALSLYYASKRNYTAS